MRDAKTIMAVIGKEEMLAKKKIATVDLQSLRPLVSNNVINNLAAESITLERLQAIHSAGGADALKILLVESVNGKARITNRQILAICEAVRAPFGQVSRTKAIHNRMIDKIAQIQCFLPS